VANRRIGGLIEFKVNGQIFSAKGSFSYNLGEPKRETIVGSDGIHGHKELPQVAMIEGVVTDNSDLDLRALLRTKDSTITLKLANDKMITLKDAIFTADGNVTTEEGEIECRFEGFTADEAS